MAESTTEHFTIVRILHGASDVPEVLNPLKGNHFMEAQQVEPAHSHWGPVEYKLTWIKSIPAAQIENLIVSVDSSEPTQRRQS